MTKRQCRARIRLACRAWDRVTLGDRPWFGTGERSAADLVGRMRGLTEACAVPELDVLGTYDPARLSYCPRQLAWAVLVSSRESCA
jgi:hypothetical protein